MRIRFQSIRATLWLKFSTKQITLLTIFGIIILVEIIIYISKWHKEFQFSRKYSQILYVKSKELNSYSDPIISSSKLDIVLSYYSEDIDFVAQYIRYLRHLPNLKKLNPRVIVYNKNSKINNEVLKLLLEADIIQLLPNLGREGGTYLHHIVNYYNIIANHTIFSQAGVEGITNTGLADWYFDRLERQFNSSVGYMPLVSNSMIATYDCGSHMTGNFPRMAQLWSVLEQSLCPPGGQAVS